MTFELLAAVALVLVPVAYSWWAGRRILRSINDPVLPELVFARTRRTTQLGCGAMILMPLVQAPILLAVPVMVLALLAVHYPVRRAIFEDSWSFGSFLRYSIASLIPSLGFWLLVMFAPSLSVDVARSLPPRLAQWQLPLAIACGATFALVILVWHVRASAVWLTLHRGSPLSTDPRHASLLTRFNEILDRSRVAPDRRPTIHRYGPVGGRITNAIALVSLREPAVAMSDTLLDTLDANEAAAIFAHEIAHHEHYDVAKLRKGRRLVVLIALLLAVLPAAMLSNGSPVALGTLMVFPIAIFIAFMLKASKSRVHETESDLRAAELTNDPDALISALTKIHHRAKLPRRWTTEVERSVTHPSLARRIQALRAYGARQAAPLAAPTMFRSADEGSACVVLADDRAYWFDGVPADVPLELAALRERAGSYRAVAYAELTELHLLVNATPAILRATDLAGHTWKVPVRADDAERVQATLDVVDEKLGTRPADAAVKSTRTARVLAAAIAIVSLFAGFSPVVALIALVTLIEPTVVSLAAMTVMTVAWFAVTAGRWTTSMMPATWAIIAVMLAAWSAWIAWSWFRTPSATPPSRERRGNRLTLGALGASAIVLALVAMPSGGESARALLAQPTVVSLLIAIGGIGAALLAMRNRKGRFAGGGVMALAAAGIIIVQLADRLWPSPSDVAWSTGKLSLVTTVPVDPGVYDVDVSALGTRYLTKRVQRADVDGGDDEEGYDERPSPYRISYTTGRFSAAGTTRTVEALDAAIVGESQLLVLASRGGDSLELRLEDADSTAVVRWREVLPAMHNPRLRLSGSSARWRLNGRLGSPRNAKFVTLNGAIAGGDVRRAEIATDTLPGSPVFAYEDGSVLVSAMSMDRDMNASSPTFNALSYMLGRNPVRWTLWRYDRSGRQLVARPGGMVRCGGAGTDSVVVCVETGLSGTRAWSVARTGEAASVATISHRLEQSSVGSGGLITSTLIADQSLAIVDVAAHRGTRASLPAESHGYASAMRATPDGVAMLLRGRDGAQLALYRIERNERIAAVP